MTEETLFHEALVKPRAERAAFLNQACAGQPDLRAAVEALLASHDAAGNMLDRPPAPVVTGEYAPEPDKSTTEQAGAVVAGKYKLLERIGEGGMGSVWLAQQSEPVKRRVAVKFIKTGMDSRHVLARFEAERQALAVMDHPNIAKILDGGVAENGSPYFVMELVKGVPITKYCDTNKLTPQQRLELFVPVCQAIQHAHQKGIIHRDIKPSNVMVALYDDKPVPKVIDFGVAKATGQSLTEKTFHTGFGGIIGTPEYMSPEQASLNNLDIDTRSDIYSLGVLLYELLAGSPPFKHRDLEKAGMLEMLRVIREDEPQRPSTKLSTADALPSLSASRGTEPTKLTGLLRNELDWIVMKALEKDRARRYETANGFAADVNRYLHGEAVLAHPPSSAYRFKKFLRKNRGPALAASLVFLALLGGMAGTTYGLFRADEQRRLAENKQAEADAAAASEADQRKNAEDEKLRAIRFRDQALDALRATTGEDVEKLIGAKTELSQNERDYLEAIAKRWQGFAKHSGADGTSRSHQAEGHLRVGHLWEKLGRNKDAQVEYQSARELLKKLVEQYSDEPRYQRELADTHRMLGFLLAGLGQSEAARAEYQCARDLQKKQFELFPTVPAHLDALAATHNDLGMLLAGVGESEAARAEYLSAHKLQKTLVEQYPSVHRYSRGLAGTHLNHGNLLADLKQREEARAEYQMARDLMKMLVEQNPAVPNYQRILATTHNSLGALLGDLGQRAAARAEYQSARDLQKNLVEQYPAVPEYQVGLGGSYCNYGNLIRNEGQPAESLEWFDRAIRTLHPVHVREPRDAAARLYLHISHNNRAMTYDRLLRFNEAVNDWDRALEYCPPQHLPWTRAKAATSRIQAGMVAEAVAEVVGLTKSSSNWNADQWYDFACVYAIASGRIADKKQPYGDRTIELLHHAVKAGYKDAAHMRKDADFEALRVRPDFKKLLAELEAKP